MFDCGFSKENSRFRYRAGGLLIHDGKILFAKNAVGGYFYILGGGVHMGETSEHCIKREFLEETGIHAKTERLAVVCENFFRGEFGEDCHVLEFYYLMTAETDAIENCKHTSDIGENLVWLPIEQIICFGMGLTLREGDREYYYAALDRHFPGLKERYIHRYGNAYELPSDHSAELLTLFHDTCQKHGILHDPDECFSYLHEFPEPYEQLSLF